MSIRKGHFSSWIVESEFLCLKECDLSFFKYNASAIPMEIVWFFDAKDIPNNGKKDVTVTYEGVEYPARIYKDNINSGRLRISWDNELGKEFSRFDWENKPYLARFKKINESFYDIEMEEDKRKRYSVHDSVWLATAIMTYEKYYSVHSIIIDDLCFRQSEIIAAAQKYANGTVQAARVSTHLCGDFKDSVCNYLRHGRDGKEKTRRLSSLSEFNGEKVIPTDIPDSDVFMTNQGEITMAELKDFVKNEYGRLVESGGTEIISAVKKTDKVNHKNGIFDKNTILFGPPGTGKTYKTVLYAVGIIEEKPVTELEKEEYNEVLKRYNEYKELGLIEFTTFHQSYGYEDFIEGIRPVLNSGANAEETGNVQYKVSAGVFKNFCDEVETEVSIDITEDDFEYNKSGHNPGIWKVTLGGTGENKLRDFCFDESCIRHGENDTSKLLYKNFKDEMKVGDIVLSCYRINPPIIDAIGVITGDYTYIEDYDDYRHQREVKWIIKGIREKVKDKNSGKNFSQKTIYRLTDIDLSEIKNILKKYKDKQDTSVVSLKNSVFIIDEINRGNISKIFGELITLIEPTKRLGQEEAVQVRLPYSNELFGVPDNVYILGTMNTADRSIALLDTALRRRFSFVEMLPDEDLLKGIKIGNIEIDKMLKKINERISVLFDREHTIGHAYFIPLKKEPTIGNLSKIFKDKIIPLLQEYFYEDYEKIRLVLGDNQKVNEAEQFVVVSRKENDYRDLFGKAASELDLSAVYKINYAALENSEAYCKIYSE